MTQYIYKIENKKNNCFYIGRTQNTKERWSTHKRLLKKNNHFNIYLQRAYNKYGDVFEYSILHEINDKDLKKELSLAMELEQNYIDKHFGKPYFYNLSISSKTGISTGKNHGHYGKHPSEWMGEGYYKGLETARKKTGSKNHFYGKHHSQETIDILSKKCSLHGEKNGFYGKSHSEDTKEKIRRTKAKNSRNINSHTRKVEVDGIVFDKVKDAIKYLGIGETTFYSRMKRGNYNYKYID